MLVFVEIRRILFKAILLNLKILQREMKCGQLLCPEGWDY
nr:MAG TPA: hypothetical protein [Caudoviricetes sp.]